MQLYEIGKLVGTGSSGDVFLCKHVSDKTNSYALKRIKTFEVNEKQRQNIQNQLKILQKLRHINIVSYKDSFTDKQGNLCIVMVHCQLGDMHTRIKQMKEKGKNFTQPQILDWLTQIALAIYYLHNQKILHRDLKSQNLFLKKDDRINYDRIKLGDFGIAKVLDSTQDLARTCIGTPYYMAPQIFKYKPYSYKSDIWSLGIILYELCNLRLPFEAQHYNAIAMKILKGSFPSIMPTYSKQLRDLIIQMLSKKPQDRPSIIDILNKPFIRVRTQKYINDLLLKPFSPNDFDDLYLDTLKEQAILLNIASEQSQQMRKYPSSKDLMQKRQNSTNKSYMTRRSQQQDNQLISQYHSKRKSTFESTHGDKNSKKIEQSSSSFKTLGLGYDININDEKQAFVDHKKINMMEKQQKRGSFDMKKINMPRNINQRNFKVQVQYTMQEQNFINNDMDDDDQIKTITQTDSQQNCGESSEDQEPPEGYNKNYYILLDKIKLLKHRCETALGGNKYLRAYNAVNNGVNKAGILQILGAHMIGYWHLIDQIMFYQSILKTLPKN